MKNFSTYLIVIFVVWVIMSGNSVGYISLVVSNGWNVTGKNLFGGIEDAISSSISGAGKAVGDSISQGLGNVGDSLLTGLHSAEVTIT